MRKVRPEHLSEGARRVIIDLKVDDRLDKSATMASKKSAVI